MSTHATDLARVLGDLYDDAEGHNTGYHTVRVRTGRKPVIVAETQAGAVIWVEWRGELYQVNVTRQATVAIRNTFPPRAACGSTRPHEPHERNTAVPLTSRHCPGLQEEPA
jgi:hypothetical protein